MAPMNENLWARIASFPCLLHCTQVILVTSDHRAHKLMLVSIWVWVSKIYKRLSESGKLHRFYRRKSVFPSARSYIQFCYTNFLHNNSKFFSVRQGLYTRSDPERVRVQSERMRHSNGQKMLWGTKKKQTQTPLCGRAQRRTGNSTFCNPERL